MWFIWSILFQHWLNYNKLFDCLVDSNHGCFTKTPPVWEILCIEILLPARFPYRGTIIWHGSLEALWPPRSRATTTRAKWQSAQVGFVGKSLKHLRSWIWSVELDFFWDCFVHVLFEMFLRVSTPVHIADSNMREMSMWRCCPPASIFTHRSISWNLQFESFGLPSLKLTARTSKNGWFPLLGLPRVVRPIFRC